MAQWVDPPPRKIDQRKITSPKPVDARDISPDSSRSKIPLASPEPALAAPIFSPEEEDRRLKAKHPLFKFTLRGHADELESEAAETKPLLGEFVMDGQATMIYAAPNTGKTLIVLYLIHGAVAQGRINPDSVFYFNADDGSRGVAAKTRLLQDIGAHMLAPGRRGLKREDLVQSLLKAIEDGTARGTLIIIDTLKKFTDPMHKKETSEFAQVCREYVMAGGTIVALGHTRKNPKADGTPQYQGTTDILEDFDAVYVAELVTKGAGAKVQVVRLKREKKRADNPDVVGYAYASEPGISYEEMLASVTPVDADELNDYKAETEKTAHVAVIAEILRLIEAGEGQGMMELARKAAEACGVSKRSALGVLKEHTGTTLKTHLWTSRTGPRNVQVYELLVSPDADG